MARVGLFAAAAFFGCGAGGQDDLADVQRAHTTATPGEVAWVRMFGGQGFQEWRRVVAPRTSNLTWVGGRSGGALVIRAYDPDGNVVEEAQVPTTGSQDLQDLAVHEDESRTVIRSGRPPGMGCVPQGEKPATEVVRAEREGTCRWSYGFPEDDEFQSPFLREAAGADGTVVIAGVTHQELHFGATVVGGDVVYDPSGGDNAGYRFVVKLDEDGGVLWAHDLGREGLGGVTVDGEDNVILMGLVFGQGHEIFKWHPDGSLFWHRQFEGISPFPAVLAASPTGDVVIAGRYVQSFTLDGMAFADAGDHPDLFLLRLSSVDGIVEGGRRLYGSGNLDVTGLSIDPHGNIVATGTFNNGSLNLGPNRYEAGPRQHGWAAAFSPLLKQTLWARAYGNDAPDSWVEPFGVAFTSTSRAMVAGNFDGTIDFGGEVRTADRAAMLLRIFP